jgi:hypothetical protein
MQHGSAEKQDETNAYAVRPEASKMPRHPLTSPLALSNNRVSVRTSAIATDLQHDDGVKMVKITLASLSLA